MQDKFFPPFTYVHLIGVCVISSLKEVFVQILTIPGQLIQLEFMLEHGYIKL